LEGGGVTVKGFCCSGEQEIVKGGFHAAACVIAAAMAAYNIAAWCFRRERHLGTNAVVYTLAVCWEAKQTMHHLRRLPSYAPRDSARPSNVVDISTRDAA
jgi:hypothetical protein